MLFFAVMSLAQDSVIPETTPASGASMSHQASSVGDLAEDVTQYEMITYNNKKTHADNRNAFLAHRLAKR